jgi:hypothetical protein
MVLILVHDLSHWFVVSNPGSWSHNLACYLDFWFIIWNPGFVISTPWSQILVYHLNSWFIISNPGFVISTLWSQILVYYLDSWFMNSNLGSCHGPDSWSTILAIGSLYQFHFPYLNYYIMVSAPGSWSHSWFIISTPDSWSQSWLMVAIPGLWSYFMVLALNSIAQLFKLLKPYWVSV